MKNQNHFEKTKFFDLDSIERKLKEMKASKRIISHGA